MKKTLSLVLLVAFIVGMMAACKPVTPAGPVDTGENNGDYPYAKVRWYWSEGNTQLPLDGYICRKIKEDINVEYIHVNPTGTDYTERLMLLISGGETPDLISSWSDLTVQLRDEGLIQPMEDYLNEEYLPNVIRVSKNWDEAVATLKHPDGHTYAIPNCNDKLIGETPWIRQDWLKKINKEIPTNLDELYEVLVAFGNGDMNGDGQPVYGTYANEFWGVGNFLGAMGCGVSTWYMAEDGLPELGMLSPRIKDALKYIKDLIANKGMNEDLMTTKFENVQEKVKAGRVGYLFGFTGYSDGVEMQKIYKDADWVYMYPVKGVYDKGYVDVGGLIREEYVVTKDCSDLEGVFRLMNYMTEDKSDENGMNFEGPYWVCKFGERGVNWDVEDGKFTSGGEDSDLQKKLKEQNQVDQWVAKSNRFRNQFDTQWMGQNERDIAINTFLNNLPQSNSIPEDHKLRGIALYGIQENAKVPAFTEEWCWTKYPEQLFYSAILGKGDIDTLYDNFLANANAAGYQEVRQLVADHVAKNPAPSTNS